jgi:hypothetical protein
VSGHYHHCTGVLNERMPGALRAKIAKGAVNVYDGRAIIPRRGYSLHATTHYILYLPRVCGAGGNLSGYGGEHHDITMTNPDRPTSLRMRLKILLAQGMSDDPIRHAEQVAEVTAILHAAFTPEGFIVTLVGGSAIEIHAPGVYVSGDMDLVIEKKANASKQVDEMFQSLGFRKEGGRHWVFGDLFIETVRGPVEGPTEEVRVGDSVFRIVTKEVALRDRVVGFKHWKHTAYGEQAIDMLVAFGHELDRTWLIPELERENSLDAFHALNDLAQSNSPVTADILNAMLEDLWRRGPRP